MHYGTMHRQTSLGGSCWLLLPNRRQAPDVFSSRTPASRANTDIQRLCTVVFGRPNACSVEVTQNGQRRSYVMGRMYAYALRSTSLVVIRSDRKLLFHKCTMYAHFSKLVSDGVHFSNRRKLRHNRRKPLLANTQIRTVQRRRPRRRCAISNPKINAHGCPPNLVVAGRVYLVRVSQKGVFRSQASVRCRNRADGEAIEIIPCTKAAEANLREVVCLIATATAPMAPATATAPFTAKRSTARLRLSYGSGQATIRFGSNGYVRLRIGYGSLQLRRAPADGGTMGAPKQACPGIAGIIADARLDLAVRLLRSGRRGPPVVSADLCKSLPLDLLAFHSDPQDRVQLSPGYRALDVETAPPRRMGGLGIRDASVVLLTRMAVGPDCACVLERYAARLPRCGRRN